MAILASVSQARQIPSIKELAQLESALEDELRVKRFFFDKDDADDNRKSVERNDRYRSSEERKPRSFGGDDNSQSDSKNDRSDDREGPLEQLKMLIEILMKLIRFIKKLFGIPSIGGK